MWDVRYRPLKFSDVIGQEGLIEVLRARLQKGTGKDTSYVFAGGHGQGKTTLARILARALLCQARLPEGDPCNACDNCLDLLSESSAAFTEMDSASRGTIEVAREIVSDIGFVLPNADKRIYLFDEAHRMSRDAQDVLLKPIEEKQLVSIFCTTEPEKIRGPIRSRCDVFIIRKVEQADILRRMKLVLDQEKVEYEDDAVLTVIDYSGGHIRDILNRLEMLSQLGPITLASVREYLRLGVVSTYFELLLSLGDPAQAVRLLEHACEQVDVADVATGLAEAAMNAFRVAQGLPVEFSLVDKDLAKKVYDMYGASTVDLASYFLADHYPTKIGLTCSIVRCASGIPQRSGAAVATAPVAVQAAKPVAPVAQLPQSAPAQVPQQAPAQPATQAQPPVTAPVSSKTGSDRKGGLGSGDPGALTDLDAKVVNGPLPRGSTGGGNKSRQSLTSGKSLLDRYLTPDEWRVRFEEVLRSRP